MERKRKEAKEEKKEKEKLQRKDERMKGERECVCGRERDGSGGRQ